MLKTDPFYPTLFDRVVNIMNGTIKRIACEYEEPESVYGCGDAQPCGRDAIGISPEHERPRCLRHLDK